MKLHKIITASIAVGIMSIAAGCMGNAAATYGDGKKYDILESHWGAPTEMQKNENGTSTAIFRAGGDCVATFNMDAQGIIMDHNIVGGCHYDAYNRLQNIEHQFLQVQTFETDGLKAVRKRDSVFAFSIFTAV